MLPLSSRVCYGCTFPSGRSDSVPETGGTWTAALHSGFTCLLHLICPPASQLLIPQVPLRSHPGTCGAHHVLQVWVWLVTFVWCDWVTHRPIFHWKKLLKLSSEQLLQFIQALKFSHYSHFIFILYILFIYYRLFLYFILYVIVIKQWLFCLKRKHVSL